MLTTIVDIPSASWLGQHNVLLGSCFSIYMGERMQREGRDTLFNPCGTLFNPLSILRLLQAMDDAELRSQSIFYATQDNEWRSWLADTRLKGATPQDTLEELTGRFLQLREALMGASHLYLTLGTNVYYSLVEGEAPVTNCHRQPDRLFREQHLELSGCITTLHSIVHLVRKLNPDIRIIFTVSPFRYRKYTLQGSQLAKATLLLAVHQVCDSEDDCAYFPAYEIMMDELRDYRWYAPDLVHPTQEAADYIWKRLTEQNCQFNS